jgi:glycosyltransferase involved in cell wall biosynthesis
MPHVDASTCASSLPATARSAATSSAAPRLGVADRVTFLGTVGDDDLLGLYAGALAVAYPPYDEDFGYVTLEAFLARKPVITCRDSGGPNEFVRDGENGYVCEPDPTRWPPPSTGWRRDRRLAAAFGDAGHATAAAITWDGVIEKAARMNCANRRSCGYPSTHGWAGADAHLRLPRDDVPRGAAGRARGPGKRLRPTGLPRVTKLIIQIPCLNEAATLPATLADLPRSVPGIDVVEFLVIDDGSRDGTADVARACGVDHIVRLRATRGSRLPSWPASTPPSRPAPTTSSTPTPTTSTPGHEIPKLLAPLLAGEADICIGDRNVARARSHVVAEAAAAAARELGRAPGLEYDGARHHQRIPRVHARGRPADDRRLGVLVHARDDHPGRQAAHGDRPRAGRDEPAHARVAAVRQHLLVHQAVGRHDRPHLRDERAPQDLLVCRRADLRGGVPAGGALSVRYLTDFTGGGRYVQSLIFSAVLMIVGIQVMLIGLLADLISANRKLIEDLLYRVRGARVAARAGGPRRGGHVPLTRVRRAGSLGALVVAEPSSVSVVIPAYNEGVVIGQVVASLAAAGPWHEIIVVDDGSRDDTAARACAAGAAVVRHPYNKGNGAAVKSGIRRASGEYVLIIDGDGQHRPDDAHRIVERLGEYDLVIGARVTSTHASHARRFGNSALNRLASYLTSREIPDLTSGFRGARREYLAEFIHLLPNGFSTPTTTTLAFIKAGYNVAFEPIEARARIGQSKIRFASDGAKFLMIILKIVTLFSPLRVFLPISLASFAVGLAYAIWIIAAESKIPNGAVLLIMFSVIVFLVGLVSEQISALRFEGRQ